MTTSGYAKFGNANPVTTEDIDPVTSCVGNTFFEKSGVPGVNIPMDMCPRFMGQRCGRKWDKFCDAYLFSGNIDMGGYAHINKDFLEQAAKEKYCRAATDQPGVQCALQCQPFNPIAQTSAQVCEWEGTQNWLDTKDEYDMAGMFPQTARLNPISPLMMDRCPMVCDAANPTTTDYLGPDDEIINKCIEYGACGDVLMDVAYYAVKNGIEVTNPKLKKLIDYAKVDSPFNPNLVAQIAREYSIPASVALELLQNPPKGPLTPTADRVKSSINQTKFSDPIVSPVDPDKKKPKKLNSAMQIKPQTVAPGIFPDLSLAKSRLNARKEGYYSSNKDKNRSIITVILCLVLFLVLAVVLFKMFSGENKIKEVRFF